MAKGAQDVVNTAVGYFTGGSVGGATASEQVGSAETGQPASGIGPAVDVAGLAIGSGLAAGMATPIAQMGPASAAGEIGTGAGEVGGGAAAADNALGAANEITGSGAATKAGGVSMRSLLDAATLLSAAGTVVGATSALTASRTMGKLNSPTIAPPVTMPTFNSPITKTAQQNSIYEQLVRRGRASTILTQPSDKLGMVGS